MSEKEQIDPLKHQNAFVRMKAGKLKRMKEIGKQAVDNPVATGAEAGGGCLLSLVILMVLMYFLGF
ncbi:MAG: hypothetical protein AAGD96_24590 [Chloroflexota bacterium]